MFGDFFSAAYLARVSVPVSPIVATRNIPVATITTTPTTIFGFPANQFSLQGSNVAQTGSVTLTNAVTNIWAPLTSAGAFKIAENESPQPQNRVYFNYNYARNVNRRLNQSRATSLSVVSGSLASLPAASAAVQTAIATQGPNTIGTVIGPGTLAVRPDFGMMGMGFQTDPIGGLTLPFTLGNTTTFNLNNQPSFQNPGTAPAYNLTIPNGFVVLSNDGSTIILGGPVQLPNVNVHLGTVGIERALFGLFSVGVRCPLLGITNDGDVTADSIADATIGDLTFIAKAALLTLPGNGSLLSVGAAVTAPTGQTAITFDGQEIHPTYIQPFVGYLINAGPVFAQGFSSYLYPTDSRLPGVLFNDFGVGMWLYRYTRAGSVTGPVGYTSAFYDATPTANSINGFTERTSNPNAFDANPGGSSATEVPFLAGIAPTVEAHVTTPLRRSRTEAVRVLDTCVITGGVRFSLWDLATLGVACGVPVTGPKPFEWEMLTQLNLNF
jgi:hypothetical protein